MIEILYLGSVFCALLTVYLLLLKDNSFRSYADYILSVYLVFQIWAVVIYLLVNSGLIIKMPHLYKTAAPLSVFTAPLSYLYVRVVLYNERKINKKDLLHLIPFALMIINYFPFFALSTAEKTIIVQAVVNHFDDAYNFKIGLVPDYVNFIFIPIQVTCYVFFQWRLIRTYKKENKQEGVQKQISSVLKWLKVIAWASTLFVIGYFILIVDIVLFNNFLNSTYLSQLPSLLVCCSFLMISTYLLVHPDVLTGLPFIKYREIESSIVNNEVSKVPFIVDDYSNEIQLIDQYFQSIDNLQDSNLNLNKIATHLHLPAREFSYIINNHYKKRFNDFLNEHRLKYIVQKLDKDYINNYTIESLAKEAGFSSKTSFYRAFNKLYKCTPMEYLDKL